MDDPIELRLDLATAEDLRNALYGLGEHQAAARPIPSMGTETSRRLGVLLRDLDIRLGGTGRFA
ncbi:hypothetical protein JMF97_11125 [Micromonospora fiedleri]|uniref:Uncharacterized protein n=1 Tax=Micromonospora fiedleri TaxID=1157498 RepID=A0ABS1ULI3_9ACTN|nr:hypothetical protein [Micromonospora fiedleri]MBL6276714.1 hypothetical protein [Micromonospora fiedleri]